MNQNFDPKTSLNMDLAKNLRRLIAERGVKVTYLSKQSGVHVQTLNNWLSGQKPRDIDQVKNVCKFFGVTLDELIYGEVNTNFEKLKEEIAIGKFEVILKPLRK